MRGSSGGSGKKRDLLYSSVDALFEAKEPPAAREEIQIGTE